MGEVRHVARPVRYIVVNADSVELAPPVSRAPYFTASQATNSPSGSTSSQYEM